MAAQLGGEFVRHGAVDRGFDVAVEREAAHRAVACGRGALVHVVGQDRGAEGGELGFGREVLAGGFEVGPLVAALRGHARWQHAVESPDAFEQAQGGRAPACHDGGVQQDQTLGQMGMAAGHHGAEVAAQRVADQDGGLADLALDEVAQLLDQKRPVGGNGVARVMPEFVERVDFIAGVLPDLEQGPVGAGREAVGVGEDDGAAGHGQAPTAAGGASLNWKKRHQMARPEESKRRMASKQAWRAWVSTMPSGSRGSKTTWRMAGRPSK